MSCVCVDISSLYYSRYIYQPLSTKPYLPQQLARQALLNLSRPNLPPPLPTLMSLLFIYTTDYL